MLESPVLDLQRKAGAVLKEEFGWRMSASYSTLEEEYAAATLGIGIVDRSYMGRLEITGDDAIDLLDRLSTNDLADLQQNTVVGTVLTTNKGRVIDLLLVNRREDGLLVLTGPTTRTRVLEWIDFYTIMEDVTSRDATEETAMFSLIGAKAAEALPESARELSHYTSTAVRIEGIDALVLRTDFAGVPGYDIVVAPTDASKLWSSFVEAGALPVGTQTVELIRIERGLPVSAKDYGEDYNPLEANLLDFISFNKGCYIGQEVVARLNTYDKVQKRLMGLSWASENEVAPGAEIYADGKKVGAVTSAVKSHRLSSGIGLGYVRKAQTKAGAELCARTDDGEVTVTVSELPFVASEA